MWSQSVNYRGGGTAPIKLLGHIPPCLQQFMPTDTASSDEREPVLVGPATMIRGGWSQVPDVCTTSRHLLDSDRMEIWRW